MQNEVALLLSFLGAQREKKESFESRKVPNTEQPEQHDSPPHFFTIIAAIFVQTLHITSQTTLALSLSFSIYTLLLAEQATSFGNIKVERERRVANGEWGTEIEYSPAKNATFVCMCIGDRTTRHIFPILMFPNKCGNDSWNVNRFVKSNVRGVFGRRKGKLRIKLNIQKFQVVRWRSFYGENHKKNEEGEMCIVFE